MQTRILYDQRNSTFVCENCSRRIADAKGYAFCPFCGLEASFNEADAPLIRGYGLSLLATIHGFVRESGENDLSLRGRIIDSLKER